MIPVRAAPLPLYAFLFALKQRVFLKRGIVREAAAHFPPNENVLSIHLSALVGIGAVANKVFLHFAIVPVYLLHTKPMHPV